MITLARKLLLIILCTGFFIAFMYQATFYTLIEKWYNSQTYAHGFMIPFLSIYLIWLHKERLKSIQWKSSPKAVMLVAVISILWWLAYLSHVNILQQFCLISLIIASVWAICGRDFVNKFSFVLLYLYFMIPFGNFLIPILQELTIKSITLGLTTLSIPYIEDGFLIYTNQGTFEVEVACSGIRYLIAALALGSLFSYMNFNSYRKHAIFMMVVCTIPVAMNGVRALIIVLIAYKSEMKYATGIDHLIYGWMLFALIMGVIFWIGSKYRDTIIISQVPSKLTAFNIDNKTCVCLIFALSLGPFFALLEPNQTTVAVVDEGVNKLVWGPQFSNPDVSLVRQYPLTSGQILDFVKIGYYSQDSKNKLISSVNSLYNSKEWLAKSNKMIKLDGDYVLETVIENDINRRIIWSWYQIGSYRTATIWKAKLYELFYGITFERKPSYIMALSIEQWGQGNIERSHLTKFVQTEISYG